MTAIWFALAGIGLFVGAFGTLVGVAGGFMLVPILLFLYPDETPAALTSITLTVAFFNALSGSVAYGRMKRIDYRSGAMFAVAAIPGAIIGANLVSLLNRGAFQYVFGSILIIVAAYMLVRPSSTARGGLLNKWCVNRVVIDHTGLRHTYTYNLPLGMVIAFFVGIVSGLLGIGGGIIHVPALTQILCFPAHIATATSHFMVAVTTFSAVGTHLVQGTYAANFGVAAVLSAGAVVGAQFGARLSKRVSARLIVRLLALGLMVVAVRLLVSPV